jgi:predicted MPP superfamily phosphohydrolase
LFAAILFVTAVAAVYVKAALIVLRRLRRTNTRPISQFDAAALILAAAGVLCMGYSRFIEPSRLAISYVEIHSSKLAPDRRPIRIVHFSDLHTEAAPRLEPRLVTAVAAEKPDVIVFTGDSINNLKALPVFRECFAALARIAPTFVVRGNWDTQHWSEVDLFQQTGAKELNGEAVRLEIGGTPIWIGGLAFDNPNSLRNMVRQIPKTEFSVLLYHMPDLISEVAAEHIDLYCAGHTHGGQVALPIYGAIVTLSRFGKRYEAGLYHEMDTWLYVNRGIGMAGGLAPRVRFWARPELTVIDIQPSTR